MGNSSLQVWSSASYTFPLPDGHRFPIAKYALLREAVVAQGVVTPQQVNEPPRAADEDLLLVHHEAYVQAIRNGTLPTDAVRRLGLPWSAALAERSWRAVGGTVAAARHAHRHGVAMNLAGGTHHAFADRGEGFCVFNDVAVAIRALQRDGHIQRALVVDLDVHQGNGTHAIFAGDKSVFTFSMHGARNFPFHKVPGSLDVELEDGCSDEQYLALLGHHLPRAIHAAQADMVFYLAGADPHEGDALGRLALTFDALKRRDAMVFSACREIGLPVVTTIAGGYGRRIEQTIQVHVNTVEVLRQVSSS